MDSIDSLDRFLDMQYTTEVVSEFLPLLIAFKDFDKPYGGLWGRSTLLDYTTYPFVAQYFEWCFEFLKPAIYEIDLEDEPIQELNATELNIINSIGCDLNILDFNNDLAHLTKDKPKGKKKDKPKYKKKDIDIKIQRQKELSFIMFNLSALSHNLNILIAKISKNIEKCRASKATKLVAVNNIQNEKLKEEEKDKEIGPIDNKRNILYQHSSLIDGKLELLQGLLKMCTREKLINTRVIFSYRLTKLMGKKGIANTTVLSWLGIKQQTLSDYKQSNTLPDTAKLMILSQQLNISIDYLLGLADTPYKNLSSYTAFKKFGFTPQSFTNIADLKANIGWRYAPIINALNYFLEEENISTFSSIANFLNNHQAHTYYTIGVADIDKLETMIIKQVEEGTSVEDIRQHMQHFKEDLLAYNKIKSEDATNLLDIQEKLKNLKQTLSKNDYSPDEKIMDLFDNFLNDDIDEYDEDYEDDDEYSVDEPYNVDEHQGDIF